MLVLLSWARLVALLSCAWLVASLSNELIHEASTLLHGNSTSGRHTNNWAVLVCASRYWFNYRVRSWPAGSLS